MIKKILSTLLVSSTLLVFSGLNSMYSIFYTQMIENLEACVAGKPIREIK